MILPRFDVLVPTTVEEACAMLAEHANDGARILAGGTDILVDLRRPIIPQHIPRCDGCPTHPQGDILTTIECGPGSDRLMDPTGSPRIALRDPRHAAPAYLISLHKLNMLKGIRTTKQGELRIGALTTITEIERHADIRKNRTALAEGADNLGSPLVRNRGTIGGNIANARPAADTAIPTIALGGTLTLKRGALEERQVASEDFATGPGQSVMEQDEILTRVNFPPVLPHSGSAYYKLANRKALEISTVGVAVWMSLEKPDGPVRDVRVALGAVGPTPILAGSVRDVLVGKNLDDKLIAKAARAAAGDARPIDDHRGSAWYRLQMVEMLTIRLLKIAYDRARGDK